MCWHNFPADFSTAGCALRSKWQHWNHKNIKKRKINIKKRKTGSGEASGACFVYGQVFIFAGRNVVIYGRFKQSNKSSIYYNKCIYTFCCNNFSSYILCIIFVHQIKNEALWKLRLYLERLLPRRILPTVSAYFGR